MNEGTTGEFAAKKVNKLLSTAGHAEEEPINALSGEDKEVLDLVGNRMLRKYLERKLGNRCE